MENKICKNKKCPKLLPEGYKHRYCEACRNKYADKFKKTGKGIVKIAGTVASIALVVVTKGKIDSKNS